jgi:Plasmid pRiA4b ORF-3-like protein
MDIEPVRLPIVRLAPYAELAEAGRGCQRLRSVRRLAEWVGAGRKVTKTTSTLTLADARKAVQDLRLPGDQGPGRTPARSAVEFTELQELWELACGAELLVEGGGVVRPGPALHELRDDDDEKIVDVWADLLDVTLEQAFWLPVLSRALVPALMALYVSPGPVPARELADVAAGLTLDLDDDGFAETAGIVPDVDEFVQALVDLDAAILDGGGVCLTPLGRYGVNFWLDEAGVDAPAVVDLGDATAAELIDLGYTANGPEELEALFSEWTSARGLERAASDLVAYAVVGDAQQRMTAFSLLDRIGPPAEQAVRRGLESTATRPHARAWLTVRGLDGGDADLTDVRWLFVDAVVAALDDDVDAVRQSLSEMELSAQEHADLLAGLWRCDHPQTVEALEALARHHPDRAVVVVAQKALLQARSPAAMPAPRRTGSTKGKAKGGSAKARAKAKTTVAKAAWAASACQLKVTLLDVRPPVWRRITVPATITLPELHEAIQTAMGWTDSHLHQFEVGGIRYGRPNPGFTSDVRPEAGVRLLDRAGEGARISYVYDFGDDWRHDVEVEKVLPPGAEVPVCLAGRGQCPPEDVGGPWGYADFLAAYGDPAHPDHEDLREWAGDGFEPDHFDAGGVTARLKHLFR